MILNVTTRMTCDVCLGQDEGKPGEILVEWLFRLFLEGWAVQDGHAYCPECWTPEIPPVAS